MLNRGDLKLVVQTIQQMTNKDTPPAFNLYTVIFLWLVLIGICTFVFTKVIKDKNNPNQQLQIEFNTNGNAEIVLKQNRQGHYVATGQINNKSVEFLVDTGATYVAVPEHIAGYLKLVKAGPFDSVTANGISRSYYTTINSIRLGAIEVRNVPASISTGMTFDEVLLGMSFLRHFDISQQRDQLIISVPDDALK